MQVILHVTTGQSAGKKCLLASQKMLQVGRAEEAEFRIPDDDQLGEIHFGVTAMDDGCFFVNLQSETETLVNGSPVTEGCELQHGDEILAGSTTFVVVMKDASSTPRAVTVPRQPYVMPQHTYCVDTTPGGLTVYLGNEKSPPASDVATQMSQHLPMYLAVRFDNPVVTLPPQLKNSLDYITVVDNPSWFKYYPVLIPADEIGGGAALIEQAWADDLIACVYSTLPKEALLYQLKTHAATFSAVDILRGQLDKCPPGFVGNVMQGISAIMLKHEVGEDWRIYVNPESRLSWPDLGFSKPPLQRGK